MHFHGFVILAAYNLPKMRAYLPKYSEYLLLLMLVWLLPDIAYASSSNSVSDVLCKVYNYIRGPIGTLIAILGVISLGLITMFGKIQISSALTVMAGIAIIFGADKILGQFLGPGMSCSGGSLSFGSGSDPFLVTLSCIMKWFLGPVGRALATLAMILLGLFATYGRMSWHQAMLVAVGVATMFGSVGIVSSLGVTINSSSVGPIKINPIFLCPYSTISVETIFCNMVAWFKGPIGKGVATIAMIMVGLGALFGKASWGLAIIAAVGIALIFGSQGVLVALGMGMGASNSLCTTGSL